MTEKRVPGYMLLTTVVVALLLLVLVYQGVEPALQELVTTERSKVVSFLGRYDLLTDEWDDTNTLASSTARIALSPVIQELQVIKRRTAILGASCEGSRALRGATVTYMEHTIRGYLAFMTDKPESEVAGHFLLAGEALGWVSERYMKLEATCSE